MAAGTAGLSTWIRNYFRGRKVADLSLGDIGTPMQQTIGLAPDDLQFLLLLARAAWWHGTALTTNVWPLTANLGTDDTTQYTKYTSPATGTGTLLTLIHGYNATQASNINFYIQDASDVNRYLWRKSLGTDGLPTGAELGRQPDMPFILPAGWKVVVGPATYAGGDAVKRMIMGTEMA